MERRCRVQGYLSKTAVFLMARTVPGRGTLDERSLQPCVERRDCRLAETRLQERTDLQSRPTTGSSLESGIFSSLLKAWMDDGFHPLRCGVQPNWVGEI
jgi:hypothetical protein